MLWLALYLPHLPLEVVARGGPGRTPLAIAAPDGQRQRVHARNRAAAAAGVHPGLAVNTALALCPGLSIRARDEAGEAEALGRLAGWAGQFTSRVSLQPPAGLLLEIGASLRLFGGLDTLLTRIGDGVENLGYRARPGVAPTPLGAWWLARAGRRETITDLPALSRALHTLPLTVLEISAKARAELRGLGLRRLGDCVRLPRAGLAKRFGPAFVTDLDRAFGLQPDPRPRFAPPERFESRLELPAEVDDSTALVFAARRLVVELCGFLIARGAGVSSLELTLDHRRGPPTSLHLGLVSPTREPDHLLGLLRERLERCPLNAPVESIALRADRPQALAAQPAALFDKGDSEKGDWQHLVERLRARLGEAAVTGLCPHDDHRPEHAWRPCPPGTETARRKAVPLPEGVRPLWLLEEPTALRLVDGRPWLGGELRLRRGPERIESGWWDGIEARRDYFIAENQGNERYWIYRDLEGDGAWYLHGVFG